MLNETGIITKLVNHYAIVSTNSQLACSSCQTVDSCGNGILEKYFSGKIFQSKVDNQLNAVVGDEVILEIPKASVSKASMVVYMVPLLALLGAAILASQITENENWIIFSSLLGLFLGFIRVFYFNKRIVNNVDYQLKMVAILGNKLAAREFGDLGDSNHSKLKHSIHIKQL